MSQLTHNFTLSELTVSQTAARRGLNNTPGPIQTANLKLLCVQALQPLRDKLNKPIIVTSGYRSPVVNRAIGGATNSAHMSGLAADIYVPGMSSAELMKRIHTMGLPVDQVIDEFGSWVHVAVPAKGQPARREYLIARYQNGGAVYSVAKF
ncbi:peptidase M15A [bacterium (Candidatus Blackallbacteria) CG17_big_fil_post_rev_8_21_14_2_50_48_46]|uniref:Peptidase M15A n=1 Tax=bacterium (Candidatus Blackallbacteria) CG17_big_fil_post_rev_8_21_14_2_50_48_46 TaxID=2014261 RepID=A0A2M7G622_9BACT|nr:MAG: peptidase M15A [bacterium (Candidatus Blackallbacteria) CG18_big_fil_WC_8_21_14_2_50_49_26]PIW17326.1 MAG: peptidase M15A [bacterium (Candidatus Blackallbacteria) CG17_big_fil_post_rev_8_21_14_2_50_48_46]PIW47442.1 MAG: peptidase M15A [bacterium (Candidatus Blackallbacteria) CG13_big_fil_rev_8_21_14_2_50_49_14]